VKPAVVRYYFDADILGLAKVVAGLRTDITYPGDPGVVITSGSGRRASSGRASRTPSGCP
jgi:hypothetical protein